VIGSIYEGSSNIQLLTIGKIESADVASSELGADLSSPFPASSSPRSTRRGARSCTRYDLNEMCCFVA